MKDLLTVVLVCFVFGLGLSTYALGLENKRLKEQPPATMENYFHSIHNLLNEGGTRLKVQEYKALLREVRDDAETRLDAIEEEEDYIDVK